MSNLTAISVLKEIQEWHLLLVGALACTFIFLEWRKNRKRRTWRILAIIVTLISLYIIYLQPRTVSRKPIQSILLMGEGVTAEVKDSLLRLPTISTYRYDGETMLLKSLSKRGGEFSGFHELPFTVDTLYTAGYVPPINPFYYSERVELIDKSPNFSIGYPKGLKLGEELTIEVNNESVDTLKVDGRVGGDSISTIVLPDSKSAIFRTIPKSSGQVFGNLKLNKETYHFYSTVKEEQKYILHLLAESPDFEWRFLKDYLESQGHAVYYESKISKEKYKSSISNWPDSLAQQKYTKDPLAFDVLLVDMEAWNNMVSQRRNTYSRVLNASHGSVIFRANPNASVSLQSIDPLLGKRVFSAKESTLKESINLLNFSGLNTFKQVADLYLYKKILPTLSISFVQIQDSYQWSLAGKNEEYKGYWSSVLNELMRTDKSDYFFATEWPVVFQPFHGIFWSSQPIDSVQIVYNVADTLKIPAVQDSVFQERYQLIFYPAKAGWYQLLKSGKSSNDFFYVHPDTTSSQSLMESSYNYEYYSYLNTLDRKPDKNSSNNKEDSLTFWFFLLFLLSISFLWIEEKI